jgi:hypothetical protein
MERLKTMEHKWYLRISDNMQKNLLKKIKYYGNSQYKFKANFCLEFNGRKYWSNETDNLVRDAFLDWEK